MPVSVMAAALREAGVKTSAEELEEVYRGAVRQHPGNDIAARNVVVQAVERDLTLLHGLVQAYFVYQRQRGTRHGMTESQISRDRPAPPPPPNGRQRGSESQSKADPVAAVASSTSTAKPQNTGGRHMTGESHSISDPAGQRDGRGRYATHESQVGLVPAPVAPATKLTKGGMRNVAKQAAGYAFPILTLKGAEMGNVPVQSWRRQIFVSGREKVVGRVVQAYINRQANVPENARTCDILSEAMCIRIQKFAAETVEHGREYFSDDDLLAEAEAYNA